MSINFEETFLELDTNFIIVGIKIIDCVHFENDINNTKSSIQHEIIMYNLINQKNKQEFIDIIKISFLFNGENNLQISKYWYTIEQNQSKIIQKYIALICSKYSKYYNQMNNTKINDFESNDQFIEEFVELIKQVSDKPGQNRLINIFITNDLLNKNLNILNLLILNYYDNPNMKKVIELYVNNTDTQTMDIIIKWFIGNKTLDLDLFNSLNKSCFINWLIEYDIDGEQLFMMLKLDKLDVRNKEDIINEALRFFGKSIYVVWYMKFLDYKNQKLIIIIINQLIDDQNIIELNELRNFWKFIDESIEIIEPKYKLKLAKLKHFKN